jgi:hypothetical protein
MNSLQNSTSLRSRISVSLSSRGNYQSSTKLQYPATTTTTSEATQNQYIALILMKEIVAMAVVVAEAHKIGRKFLEHLREKKPGNLRSKIQSVQPKRRPSEPWPWSWPRPIHSQTSILYVSS